MQNDLEKLTRIAASKFPKVALIDNVNFCNLRCSMCDYKNIHKYRKKQKMPFDLYTKIIDELAENDKNIRIWNIFFGDPFLCKDMPKRIKYAKNKGMTDVVLNTNGMLMDYDSAVKYIDAGLDALYVGIDASTSDTYNKIRVGGNYYEVVDNVLMYRELLESHGNGNQTLFVQFVVSDLNEFEVDDFTNFWKKENVNVKIRPKVSWGGLITAENLKDNSEIERKPCFWLMNTINICSDGRVALCSVDLHCQVPSGNVKTQTIKEIWEDKLAAYREMQLTGKFDELPDFCKNCKDWQSCYSEYK